MAANFNTQALRFFFMICLTGISFTGAFPSPASDDEMVHNNNYDMIMPDDHVPAESMQLQNFDEFYNAAAPNDAMAEMEMDESRTSAVILAPQPLNARERHVRQVLEDLDVQREKRVQRSLTKGSTIPLSNVNDWEKFDYEMLVNHH